MKILYANWDCYGKDDVVKGFSELGHEVIFLEMSQDDKGVIEWSFVERTEKMIEKHNIDFAFSLNFFPAISVACCKLQREYICHIYDSPYIKAYSSDIVNSHNHVFTFDRGMCDELNKMGIKTVHYAPVAVGSERSSSIKITAEDRKKYECDVSFVGSLYDEKHNLYDRLVEKIDDKELLGYLKGILVAQSNVYGANFLEECLTEDVIEKINKAMPYPLDDSSFATLPYIYGQYFLARKLAYIERKSAIERLSTSCDFNLYTHNKTSQYAKEKNKGEIDYYTEMPKVFQCSKINLNLTLRSIKTGIPLRAMDIMGAGGFLLTNYQDDFLLHFEPDKDFVYFTSHEECKEKVKYYLSHEEERKQIALNGLKRVQAEHTYPIRLKQMIEYVFH